MRKILASASFITAIVMLYKGYDKMTNYYGGYGDYGFGSVNAYVGGDAYNYIINGNYATGFYVLALLFTVLGIGLLIFDKLCTINTTLSDGTQENIRLLNLGLKREIDETVRTEKEEQDEQMRKKEEEERAWQERLAKEQQKKDAEERARQEQLAEKTRQREEEFNKFWETHRAEMELLCTQREVIQEALASHTSSKCRAFLNQNLEKIDDFLSVERFTVNEDIDINILLDELCHIDINSELKIIKDKEKKNRKIIIIIIIVPLLIAGLIIFVPIINRSIADSKAQKVAIAQQEAREAAIAQQEAELNELLANIDNMEIISDNSRLEKIVVNNTWEGKYTLTFYYNGEQLMANYEGRRCPCTISEGTLYNEGVTYKLCCDDNTYMLVPTEGVNIKNVYTAAK